MLVLSRRKNQSILIGENQEIIVTVLDVERGGKQVKIGIQAPLSHPILRDELYDAWKQEQPDGGREAGQAEDA